MDHYDSTDDEREEGGDASAAVVARALGGRSSGIVLDDPYLAAGGADSDDDDDDGLGDLDSEDKDDYVLRDTDLLVLAARTEDDVSTLEVWVYEEASSSTGGWVGGWIGPAHIHTHQQTLIKQTQGECCGRGLLQGSVGLRVSD